MALGLTPVVLLHGAKRETGPKAQDWRSMMISKVVLHVYVETEIEDPNELVLSFGGASEALAGWPGGDVIETSVDNVFKVTDEEAQERGLVE